LIELPRGVWTITNLINLIQLNPTQSNSIQLNQPLS
jgi:hypothetical protein